MRLVFIFKITQIAEHLEFLARTAQVAKEAYEAGDEAEIKECLLDMFKSLRYLNRQYHAEQTSLQQPLEDENEIEADSELEPLFYTFLGDVCTNYEIKDSKGIPLHVNLNAKKLSQLDETYTFAQFKFRITAFSRAFCQFVAESQDYDFTETEIMRYLYEQRYLKCLQDTYVDITLPISD